MPFTIAYQVAGKTVGLSVANTSHAAVTIDSTNPAANGLLFTNTSTAEMMYIEVVSTGPDGVTPTAVAATIPGDGTKGSFPILSYNNDAIVGLRFPVSVTAISSIAGPTLLTATPVIIL